MKDTLHREIVIPCNIEEAWEHVAAASWLGDEGELDPVVGAEGWVTSEGETRYLVVDEVDEGQRLVFRWASFLDEPSRVEIVLETMAGGTRVVVSESPLRAKASATLCIR